MKDTSFSSDNSHFDDYDSSEFVSAINHSSPKISFQKSESIKNISLEDEATNDEHSTNTSALNVSSSKSVNDAIIKNVLLSDALPKESLDVVTQVDETDVIYIEENIDATGNEENKNQPNDVSNDIILIQYDTTVAPVEEVKLKTKDGKSAIPENLAKIRSTVRKDKAKYRKRLPIMRRIVTYSHMRKFVRDKMMGRHTIVKRNQLKRKLFLNYQPEAILSRHYNGVIRKGIHVADRKMKNFSLRCQFMSKSSRRHIRFNKLKAAIDKQERIQMQSILIRRYNLRKDNQNPLTCSKHGGGTGKCNISF